jgi:hypothetical protein
MSDINPKANAFIPPQLGSTNRGYDNRISGSDAPEMVVSLETINDTIMDYFQNIIQPTIISNDEAIPVPIMYGAGERWASVLKYGGLRDEKNDRLQAPLIIIRRTGEKRNSLTNPSNKYLYTTLSPSWNPRNVYDKFSVQNNITPSQQLRHIIVPDYMDLTYDIIVWTDLQQQMDTILEQINVEAYEYWGNRNTWKFRVSIDEYQNENKLPATEDRTVRKMFTMKVGAYLIPERMVKNFKLASTNTKSYTVKKVITMIETVNNLKNSQP